MLANPTVTAPIVGASRPEHLTESLKAADLTLPPISRSNWRRSPTNTADLPSRRVSGGVYRLATRASRYGMIIRTDRL